MHHTQVKQEEPTSNNLNPALTNPYFPSFTGNPSYANVVPKREAKQEPQVDNKIKKAIYKPQRAVVQRRDKRSRKKTTKNGLDRNLFFKTKICPFLLAGHCSKRDRCTYAHSQFELRDAPNLKKTKMCQLFLLGRCQMGLRCSYAHGEHEMRSMDRFKVQTMSVGPEYLDQQKQQQQGLQNDVAKFYRDLTQGSAGGFRFTGNANIGYSATMVNPMMAAAQNQFMNMMNMQNMQVKAEQNPVKQEQTPQTGVLQPSTIQNQNLPQSGDLKGTLVQKQGEENKENVNIQMVQKQEPVKVNPAGQKAIDSFTMTMDMNIDHLIQQQQDKKRVGYKNYLHNHQKTTFKRQRKKFREIMGRN